MKSIKKSLAVAMLGVMSFGVLSASAAPALASTPGALHATSGVEMTQLRRDYDRDCRRPRHKNSEKRYSKGSMTTAAIAGAVIGAVIAKNT